MRALDKLADGALALAVLAVLAMMLHVTGDVLAKYLLGAPFVGTIEMVSSYYMIGCVFLPLIAVQRDGQQIAVPFFTDRLAPRSRAVINGLALLLTAAFVALLAWMGSQEAWTQTQSLETTSSTAAQFQIWPTRWFPVIGYVGACAYLLVQGLQSFGSLRADGATGVQQ
jgi:TRAP-type C4-dicarboxylate transport system permease small subunit